MINIKENPGAVTTKGIACWNCKGQFYIPVTVKDPKCCCYCGIKFREKKTQMGVIEEIFGPRK